MHVLHYAVLPWLFSDSVKGAESSAIVYSLVETAKANGVEPYEYLLLVLSRLPYYGKTPSHEILERLSQDLCKPPEWCRIEAPHRRF